MPTNQASCWGENSFGELGNGTTTDSHVAVQVSGLPSVNEIDAGDYHVCAIDQVYQTWCWGKDNFGQLGNGTITKYLAMPVKVAGSLQATQIGAGNEFSCALTLGGAVYCWGRGDEGQLGDATYNSAKKPKQVVGLPPASAIAVGGFHACAILSDGGAVRCWGANTFGALGNGSTTSSDVPVPVTGLSNVTAITAGGFHTCALIAATDAQCWGYNGDGQLGDGTNTNRLIPTQVVGLTQGAFQISAGLSHTCATVGLNLDCWGDGYKGELGDGVFASSNVPVPYLGPALPPSGGKGSAPWQVSAGYLHTCVSMTTGVVECFGSNENGELGNGAGGIADMSAVPVLVIGLTSGTQAVGEGYLTGCVLTQGLGVKCWGSADGNDFGLHTSAQDVTALQNGVGVLGVGDADACALSAAGALSCWGVNPWGEVGVGDQLEHATPQPVSGISATAVVGGANDTCAIDIQSAAWCWGANEYGQIGDDTQTPRFTPTGVQKLPGKVTQIVNSGLRGCAVVNKGKAFCWGDDTDGALGHNGSGQKSLPVAVLGLPSSDPVQMATGQISSCALVAGGQIWCWGSNLDGELGNGSPLGSHSNQPVQVSLGGTATQLAGLGQTFCALVQTGDVFCWGDGTHGELGDNATSDSNVPVQVVNLGSRAIEISGVGYSACALLENPVDVQCWGDNYAGELGDGSTSNSDVPVSVQGL
jgi:alpha-tubulin suppressor-like RCC1 family protein